MEKNIYTLLIDHLRRSGFGILNGAELEENVSLIIAAQYALCNRHSEGYHFSRKHKKEIARKLKIEPDELDLLLATLKEMYCRFKVESFSERHNIDRSAVETLAGSLTEKGFLIHMNPPKVDFDYCVSIRGMMCLLSEQPMDQLNESFFVRIPGTLRPVFDRGGVQEPEKNPTDVPFLSMLKKTVGLFRENSICVSEVVEDVEENLSYEQNAKFRKAFSSIGYDNLSDEQKAFLLVLCDHFVQKGSSPMSVGSTVSDDSDINPKVSAAAPSLVTAGLVVIPPVDANMNNKDDSNVDRYILSADAAGVIFHGMNELINYSTICRQAEVWKSESIAYRTLLFDDEMTEKVSCLKSLVDPEKSKELMGRLSEIGRKSLTCLFYGAPGVGKTELCKQLARETGRDCIVADPAKLSGSFVGDTEKNVREIFRAYKYLYKISDSAPILVFNEADGILSKRLSSVERAVDKMENAVQGIILQELEDFEGIFIATTNLQNNLDEASDRRFLYKMRFDYPSPKIRKEIIKMKMKWISDDDALTLANEYRLSGGQIDNLASKCVIEKFQSGRDVSLEKMRAFCAEELSLRQGKSHSGSKIGFIRYPNNF